MRKLLEFLRNGSWLVEERVVFYARTALAAYAALAVFLTFNFLHGAPLGGDYVGFWAAGSFALAGKAATAYDVAAHAQAQQAAWGGAVRNYYPWAYPPLFLLPMAVFAALPYGASLLCWLVVSGALYVVAMRALLPHPRTALVALAWPGAFDNALRGQNGFLSAALLAGGLSVLETRPLLAGALLGALAYKPHLALLVPIALLAGNHWRAFGAAALTVAVLCGVTLLLWGTAPWLAFEEARRLSQDLLEGTHGVFVGKIGVFSAVRQLGGSVPLAWLVQAPVSIAMALLVAVSWRRRAPLHLRGAVLVAATPLATPWFNLYDLVILGAPAAWLVGEGLRSGFRPWERLTLALLAVIPFVSLAVVMATRVQVAPLLELAFLAVLRQRLLRSGEPLKA